MTAALQQLIAEFYPPQPRTQPRAFKRRLDKRSTANRLLMRRKREQWHAQGLNSHGKPIGSNKKYRNQKYLKLK